METIEVIKEQKEIFEELSRAYNMEIGDILLKCVKSVHRVLKEWEEE